jgi:hypothetical protein
MRIPRNIPNTSASWKIPCGIEGFKGEAGAIEDVKSSMGVPQPGGRV